MTGKVQKKAMAQEIIEKEIKNKRREAISQSFKQNQRPVLQISSKRLAKSSFISYMIAFMTMKI